MLASQQYDLFVFSEAKENFLDWKSCGLLGCKIANCYCIHNDKELRLTYSDSDRKTELEIIDYSKQDGFGVLVFTRTFTNESLARDFAESWAARKSTLCLEAEPKCGEAPARSTTSTTCYTEDL